ncbi:hypothetical protein [Nostoc sp.]|uniref:hypothetical protein n=1 Tax=Nostoc sp. TaxID=1180 RepID=UPI002FFC0E55
MTNVNGLTQITNQEAILEEINEEELQGVVGGGLVEDLIPPVVTILTGVGGAVGVLVPRLLNTVATLTL